MIILGIDPGYAITGIAVLKEEKGNITPLYYDAIITEKINFEERIKIISLKLEKIIDKYLPEEAGIEKLYFNKNSKTAISVAEVRGAIILTLIKKGVKIFHYTPLQVKKSVVGYGGADKYQMQNIVKLLLNLEEIPEPDDVADAIAVGICHINSSKFNKIINKSVKL